MSAQREQPKPIAQGDAQRELLRAIAGLRYGTVEATMHDGRIVQIERREKIRLTGNDAAQPASIDPTQELTGPPEVRNRNRSFTCEFPEFSERRLRP
jgi:hypothetical protein